MPKMNVMDAVVRVMESEGTDVVFGVPGAAILPLYEALAKSTRIRHLSVRHEEGGTHAADGYARVTGKVGVNIGTSGPAVPPGRSGRPAGTPTASARSP